MIGWAQYCYLSSLNMSHFTLEDIAEHTHHPIEAARLDTGEWSNDYNRFDIPRSNRIRINAWRFVSDLLERIKLTVLRWDTKLRESHEKLLRLYNWHMSKYMSKESIPDAIIQWNYITIWWFQLRWMYRALEGKVRYNIYDWDALTVDGEPIEEWHTKTQVINFFCDHYSIPHLPVKWEQVDWWNTHTSLMTSTVDSTKQSETELLHNLSHVNDILDKLTPSHEYDSMTYILDTEERSSIKTILRGLNDWKEVDLSSFHKILEEIISRINTLSNETSWLLKNLRDPESVSEWGIQELASKLLVLSDLFRQYIALRYYFPDETVSAIANWKIEWKNDALNVDKVVTNALVELWSNIEEYYRIQSTMKVPRDDRIHGVHEAHNRLIRVLNSLLLEENWIRKAVTDEFNRRVNTGDTSRSDLIANNQSRIRLLRDSAI